MKALLHKILYRTLPLEGYLRAVSRLFFISYRLGLGRRSAATEYVYHLPRLAKAGDTAIDIGANLVYYARPLSEIVGTAGRVHAVEPVPVVCRVLRRNLRGCRNVEIFDCALGAENKEITMSNDSARETGYLGTGRNFVGDAAGEGAVTDQRHDLIIMVLQGPRPRHAQRHGNGVGGVAGDEGIMDAFVGLGKPGKTVQLPQCGKQRLTAGEGLVDVGLMAGVEHDGVPRGAEGAVQRDRQLDDPEVGAEVAAGARH